MNRELDAVFISDRNERAVNLAEPRPPRIELSHRRRGRRIFSGGAAFTTGGIAATMHGGIARHQIIKRITPETLPRDRHTCLAENTERVARILQIFLATGLSLHELLGNIRKRDAVDVQAPGTDALLDFQELI